MVFVVNMINFNIIYLFYNSLASIMISKLIFQIMPKLSTANIAPYKQNPSTSILSLSPASIFLILFSFHSPPLPRAMASSNENPNPRYPSPNKTLAAPGRPIRSGRNPSTAVEIPLTALHNQNRPNRSLSPPPMVANALLREQRRQHFQNNFRFATNRTTTTTTITTTRHSKFQKFWLVGLIVAAVIAFFGFLFVMYYVFGPRAPNFTIEQITIYSPSRFSTALNITMKVTNPSRHVAVFYKDHSSVVASYSGIRLCSGGFPPFYQPPLEETRLQYSLTGLAVDFPDDVSLKLKNDKDNKMIPMALNMMVMVRFKIGKLMAKSAVVKVSCELVLEDLMRTYTPDKISGSCYSTASFWSPIVLNSS